MTAPGQITGRGLTSHLIPGSASTIPFHLVNGYSIVVQGMLGSRKCNMLLDTGANPSIIDSRIAAELHLSGSDAVMALMNGPAHFEKAELPELQLGPLWREKLPVLVRDLSFMRGQLGMRIDAVVGMDVLSAMNFTIDYGHERLIFAGPVDEDDEIDFAGGSPFIVVNVSVADAQLRLLVDTGTSGIVLFDSMLHGNLHETSLATRKEGINLAGRFETEKVLLSELQLSRTRVTSIPAFRAHDQQGWGQTFDGLLGPTAVGMTKVTFDFKAGKIRWKH